jgi:L-alanine-DL-glutamate epimerase-like enolase superfamily enzyme
MLDANLRIPADHGREWLAALAPFDPVWLEEPLATHDHAKLAQLRRASTISIAAGESESEPSELADLVSRQAVDFIQPDIHRVGLGAASNVCRQARDTDVAVAPHMAHEVSAHLLSGLPGDGWLEYFNWFEQWWETPVVPLEGWITPLPVAGHGVRLRPGWLESHAI